jgi:hypothetical protein
MFIRYSGKKLWLTSSYALLFSLWQALQSEEELPD